MTDTMARLSAVTAVVLVIAAAAVLYVTSNPGISGTPVRAEFRDAYPLLEGMHVRIGGAVAGSVSEVELSDRGSALITMQLHEGTEPPRRDAAASIRQEDITGDSYVSLSPGDDPEELGDGVIPLKRTMVAPRFDDLLNSFDEPVRQGVKFLLTELGMTLERRGEDVNRALLHLRPALRAANGALAEVNSQNETLKAVIADAERVTGQAAGRTKELGQLVEGLTQTTGATAERLPELDRALEIAPGSVARTRGTLSRLTRVATAGRPLAEALGDAAPELARSTRLLGPFLDDAEAILGDADPTLALTARALRAGLPTLRSNPRRALTAPFDLATGLGGLLDSLLGDRHLLRSLFGATAYGELPGARDDLGLGAVAVELGTQQFYPEGYDPERRFLRAIGVLSCETFGLPIAPGCLLDALAGRSSRGDGAERASGRDPRDIPARPTRPAAPKAPRPALPLDPRDLPRRLERELDRILDQGPRFEGRRGEGPERDRHWRDVRDLLDFVLGR